MHILLSRLCGALLSVPLMLSKPILRAVVAHGRRTGDWRLRPPTTNANEDTRPEPAIRALQATPTAMRAMRDEMRRVLDEDESHRQAFHHLARFERKFAKHGLGAMEQVPVDQLRRALADFESLVRNWSSASLADLRSRMAVVLADRSSAASVWIAVNSVSHAGRAGPESVTVRLARKAGTSSRSGRRTAADGGWSSTSAPA
jgi:hypothetical protein